VKEHGIEVQQHQLLLAVRGLPEGVRPTVRELAARLFIQHHSAVELISRLEARGAIRRRPGTRDKREVLIQLTRPAGPSCANSRWRIGPSWNVRVLSWPAH